MHIISIPMGSKSKLKKNILLKFLGISYFGFMLLFGILYWILANYSWGDFFIFQEDIHLNTKINAFERELGLDNSGRGLKESVNILIRSDEYRRRTEKVETAGGRVYIASLDGELGEIWAGYYCRKMMDKGVTHIAVKRAEDIKLMENYDTCKLQIVFYKSKVKDSVYRLSGHKKKENFNFTTVGSIDAWVLNYADIKNSFLFNNEYYFCPVEYSFKNIMKSSITFLDNSPDVLKKVVDGQFTYPVLDFMYFSTVTITTLGYGDILPNSTLVRVLVMLESMIGVIIVGAFVSCLFWDRREYRP